MYSHFPNCIESVNITHSHSLFLNSISLTTYYFSQHCAKHCGKSGKQCLLPLTSEQLVIKQSLEATVSANSRCSTGNYQLGSPLKALSQDPLCTTVAQLSWLKIMVLEGCLVYLQGIYGNIEGQQMILVPLHFLFSPMMP